MSANTKSAQKVKQMTAVAMFCALAYVCACFIKVPVGFLSLDVKDAFIILCSLLFGPISGLFIAIAVPLLFVCLAFAGGIVILLPLALVGLAFGLLKACV